MTPRILIAIALCAISCGSAATPSTDAAPQQTRGGEGEPTVWNALSLPQINVLSLQCRGGAGYEFKSLGYKGTAADLRVAVAMIFAASPIAPGSRNEKLAPGMCAVFDRPLMSTEPRELHFITAAFAQPFVGFIDVAPSAAERQPDVRSIADYLKDANHYWTFHVADTRRGYFDVTTHQHWTNRPPPPPEPSGDRSDVAARWFVRVSADGGIAGSHQEASINADGRLFATGSGTFDNVRCTAELSRDRVQAVEAAIARSHVETWLPSYVSKQNPNRCCDQIRSGLHVEREDERGGRTSRETYWYNDSASMVPAGIAALFKAVYEARNACVF